jgi:hypothetical protein
MSVLKAMLLDRRGAADGFSYAVTASLRRRRMTTAPPASTLPRHLIRVESVVGALEAEPRQMALEVSERHDSQRPDWPGSVAFRSAEALSCSGDVAALAREAPREVSSLTYSSQNCKPIYLCESWEIDCTL